MANSCLEAPLAALGVDQPEVVDEPARMEVVLLERHVSDYRTVLVGEGRCPHCRWGPMLAEVPQRGYCPVCSGPIFAVLRARTRPSDAPREVLY